jgi:uncharacterized OB-fold protein
MSPAMLLIARCESCHSRFVPRPGSCPRCGSSTITPHPVPAHGIVLASVELANPATGWPAPHRLALIELEESVRVLALAGAVLPALGDSVDVERDGERYRVTGPHRADP